MNDGAPEWAPIDRWIVPALSTFAADADSTAPLKLRQFVTLLRRWNRTHNLTGSKSAEAIARRHIADALSIMPTLREIAASTGREGTQSGRFDLLDLASGAGLPGMVVAICAPQWSVTLLDAAQKRVAFCVHAIGELGLHNARAVHARFEHHAASASDYDAVTVRGFGPLSECWLAARSLLSPGGTLVAMKGKYPDEELAEVRQLGENARALPVSVPGLAEDRHLIMMRRNNNGRDVAQDLTQDLNQNRAQE